MKRKWIAAFIMTAMVMTGSQTVLAQESSETVQASEAAENAEVAVSAYTLNQKEGYDSYTSAYQITGIKSISNNGGTYGGSVINRAIDGNFSTHWETGRQNSASFSNEVTVTFEAAEKVASIVFAPRKDAGNKGYPNEFSIYASAGETGNDFELIAKGTAKTTSGLAQFEFPETECRRIKFVYNKAFNYWASAGEFQFFRTDTVLKEVDHVFTNGLMNELSDKYKDKTVLESYLTELEAHPLAASYQPVIEGARKLLNGEALQSSEVFLMPQKGNEVEERDRAKISYAQYALESTGIFIKPSEVLRIYVDADPNGRMPEVVTGFSHFTRLNPGYNEFKLPDDATGSQRIQLANRALPEHQAYAPRIRIEGGSNYPVYWYGKSNNETFMEELKAYAEGVKSGNGNPDFTEISSENILICTSSTGAYKGLKSQLDTKGRYADYTLDVYEDMYRSYVEYSGFDYDYNPERPWNMRPRGKFILTVHPGGPYGWAQHGWTGYNGGANRENEFWSGLVQAGSIESGSWATFHEIGHSYDNVSTTTQESTNNLYALMMQDKYLDKNRMVKENRWQIHFTAYHNTKQYPDDQLFLGAITYQLEGIYGSHIHADAQRIARENKDNWLANLNNKERMAVAVSKALELNVLPHYEYYGIAMSDRAKELVSSYPEIGFKSYYANDKTFAEDKSAFTVKDAKPVITAEGSGTITLNLSIDQPDNALLVYEIYRNDEFLGVTYGSQFVDKTAVENTEYTYTAIAYDREFNPSVTSDAVVKGTSEPVIYAVGDMIISMNREFDPLAYVKAFDAKGNEITNAVTVKENNVNTSVKGTYRVTYEVADQFGNKAQMTADVVVAGESVYLSAIAPSENSGYYKTNINPSSKGIIRLKDGKKEVPYYNGIAAHANTTVTYKLDKDYEYFEAYVGLDNEVRNQKASSVTFEVYLDGEKVYDSGKVIASDDRIAVKVPLNGAGTLKLVTTNAGDGSSYDHAVWADAKLVTENGHPNLTIGKDMAVKVGETADTDESYQAVDLEDGDITANVAVSGEVNFDKAGNYAITYTVTDSDQNTVSAQRTISVVDMRDFTYVSDQNWVSASAGWGNVGKDQSPSGNAIRLTDSERKEVTFEKGIGAHASSKVVYDLTQIDAKYFSAYVGVDRAMYNTVGSVGFEIWVDGVKVYNTDVIRANDPMQYIELNLAGAKKLELITNDGGNGIGSDHSVWGDAKFYYANPDRVDKEELEALYEAVNAADTTKITLESVQIIHDLKDRLGQALEQTITQEQIDELAASAKESFAKVEESQRKKELGAALEDAYSGKYDKYQETEIWQYFDGARTTYTNNYNSETAFTEAQFCVMMAYLSQCIDMLENQA